MNNVFIGIDPGQSGAIAVITPANIYVRTLPFVKNELDGLALHGWLESLSWEYPDKTNAIAYVEKVGAMPEQGVVSMWNFGYTTGQIHMWLKMAYISFRLITPQNWKKEILAGTDKSKEAAINYCLRMHPNILLRGTEKSTTYHTGMADALCLADLCYAKERNE